MSKISLLKLVDKTIGRGLVFCSPRAPVVNAPAAVMKALFIRPGGIGDAVLLIPALRILRRLLPDCSLDILAENRNGSVFSLLPGIHSVYRYDVPGELAAAITNRYDVVIDTEQWHRLSALTARLTRAPMMIGYGTNNRRKLFNYPVAYSHDEYEVQSFFNLLAPLTGPLVWNRTIPFLQASPHYQLQASARLASLASMKIVSVFPGGSIKERRWEKEKLRIVAGSLSEKGYSIVVIGGREDAVAGSEIIRGIPNSLNLAGILSLSESAAVLSRSELLITGDSGIMHIGYGLGKKIVALFGPGREKKWAPRGNNCIVLNKNLDCSPCTTFGDTPKCKKKAACMRAISVDEVLEASLKLLSST